MTLLASIHLNDLVSVDRVQLVRVHDHTKETRVGLWGVKCVSHMKIHV